MSDVTLGGFGEINGLKRVAARIDKLVQEGGRRFVAAARAEMEIELTEAKARTPVDTGALRASGHVDGPDGGGRIRVVFGGPAAPYAVKVHEDLSAYHAVGQAKFLESVLLESAPYLAQRIADRMKK